MSAGKMFPIQSATACRLKWSWSTLYLNSGKTSSCHRASHSTIDPETFDNFHNTTEKLKARQAMLDNAWPGNGCEYCRDIEVAGGVSDRMFQNQIPEVYPQELDIDSQQINVNPSILEVFFSNTCNLKCVYCEGNLSSAIQAEDIKFGNNIFENSTINNTNKYKEFVPKFWNWFEKNSQSLMRLQILGGEPLLQKDFFKLIEFFNANPHPDLEFNIVTNLSVPNSVIEKTSELMFDLLKNKKVKRVDIQASVDCWGPGQEYVRSGFESNLFEQNLMSLIKRKAFRIGLLSTVCSLTIPEMSQLARKYQQWNQAQEIFWYMHLVLPRDGFLSPTVFGSTYLVDCLEEVYNLLPDSTWDQKQTLDVLSGIIKTTKNNSQNNNHKQQQLVEYLDKIDYRRGTNWKNVFPWVEKELKNVV